MSIPDPASLAPEEGDASRPAPRPTRLQFSLASLLLLMALLASSYALFRDTRAWGPVMRISLERLFRTEPHLSSVNPFFSPDGSRVFLTWARNNFGDTQVRAWDVGSGREAAVLQTLTDPDGEVPMAFFPGGRRLAIADRDDTVHILETASFKEVGFLKGHLASLRFIRIFPDGSRVLTAASDGSAQIWDATTGRSIARLDTSHLPQIPHNFNDIPCWQIEFLDADISRDGTRVAAVAKSPISRTPFGVWDAGTGALVTLLESDRYCSMSTPGRSPAFIRFVMDDRGVVADEGSYTLGLFDARDGKKMARFRFPCGTCEGCWDSVEVSPDGNRFYARTDRHRLVVCDVRNGTSCVVNETANPSRERHGGSLWNLLAVSPDGRRILTCYPELPPRIRDAETLELLDELTEPWSSDGQTSAGFSHDGRTVAVCSIVVGSLDIWTRRRPELWWGIACLAEFWIALVAGIALIASLIRSVRGRADPSKGGVPIGRDVCVGGAGERPGGEERAPPSPSVGA